MYRSMSTGRLFPETPELVVEAPAEFFCPLSGCLMIEPVRLCNTGQDFDRRSLEDWRRSGCHFDPLTGQRLEGWIVLRSNDELRAAIHAWAESMQLDLELVATVTFCLLNKQAAGRARAAAAAAAAAASSAPAAGFLGAGSPSRSLLSNAFAVPEDDTWAQQGTPEAGDGWLSLGTTGRNASTDSSASATSAAGDAVMLRARSRSL